MVKQVEYANLETQTDFEAGKPTEETTVKQGEQQTTITMKDWDAMADFGIMTDDQVLRNAKQENEKKPWFGDKAWMGLSVVILIAKLLSDRKKEKESEEKEKAPKEGFEPTNRADISKYSGVKAEEKTVIKTTKNDEQAIAFSPSHPREHVSMCGALRLFSPRVRADDCFSDNFPMVLWCNG